MDEILFLIIVSIYDELLDENDSHHWKEDFFYFTGLLNSNKDFINKLPNIEIFE